MVNDGSATGVNTFTIHNSPLSIHNFPLPLIVAASSEHMTFYGPVLALAIYFLLRARRKIQSTTLAAVWAWALVGMLAVGGVEFALSIAASENSTDSEALPWWAMSARYAAAVLALCPTIALLGAKRPQNRAWQWVVLAFWAILLVPAARVVLLYSESRVSLHTAQGVFLLIIVAMGAANWIATRYWIAATFAAAAQLLLVAPYTPLAGTLPELSPQIALAGALLALLICRLLELRPRNVDPMSRVWLDFRDQFGLFWAARVMARMNIAARSHDWPIAVSWRKVEYSSADASAREAFDRSLRMLLRRFISSDWLAERSAKS
jgi:hypothetical protein